MPAHAVVAEPREEVEDWVVGPQLAALREAPADEGVSMGRSHVLLERTVFADAGDEALGRKPVLVSPQGRSTRFVSLDDILGRFVAIARVQRCTGS